MKIVADQTTTQKNNLILDFLRSRKGDELDCMQARQKFQDRYGIYEDHHPFADALDYMHTNGEATITKPGGFTRYLIS